MEERIKKVEERLDRLEADFYGMMKAFGIKGECDIKYEKEFFYEQGNYILLVTCVGNLDGDDFCWTVEWQTAVQAENSFMNEVQGRLFNLLRSNAECRNFEKSNR